MGDPKKQRKKFSKPNHPWQKERIDAEKEILKKYGLRRKEEIWKMESLLKSLMYRTKTIIGERTSQSEIEKKQLLSRLNSLGLLKKDHKIEDVLNLTLSDIMERRLQTLLQRKQLAKTMMQARQMITHEHVAIGNRKITSPSYLVSTVEDSQIRLVRPLDLMNQTKQKPEENQS